jgi:N-acetylneuraminic acid mutarotase
MMLDKWTLLSINLPTKLAKYGLCKFDDSQIIIAGGISSGDNSQYSCSNHVYKLDSNINKWMKLARFNFKRPLFATMPLKENWQIFAIGGTVEGTNEVYDIKKKKWNTC